MENKYKIIFMIGPPGVGKNTQCDKLPYINNINNIKLKLI